MVPVSVKYYTEILNDSRLVFTFYRAVATQYRCILFNIDVRPFKLWRPASPAGFKRFLRRPAAFFFFYFVLPSLRINIVIKRRIPHEQQRLWPADDHKKFIYTAPCVDNMLSRYTNIKRFTRTGTNPSVEKNPYNSR